jgi:AraC-like DNA-binding protein
MQRGLTAKAVHCRKLGNMAELIEREYACPTVEAAESALGRWTVARWTPPPSSRLFALVEQVWYFDGTLAHQNERVFPDGRAEIIVMLDEPHRDGDSARLPAFPAVCINGLRTRPSVVIAPRGRCRVLGIRVEPLGAYALLQNSIRDLTDVTIDLRDALGGTAEELGNRCADAADAAANNPERAAVDVCRTAAEWVAQRTSGKRVADRTIEWAFGTIRNARGNRSIDEIGYTLGLSRSQFAERFGRLVGVTPKRFARIVRFSNALSTLVREDSIVSTATELAYYDQAHMYRDFREFAGITPRAFLAARRYGGSASLAE